MVLKETGVRLTAQGATGFLRTMGSATKAVADFGKEGNVVSKGIRSLGDNVLGVGKVLGGVFVAGVGAAAVGIGLATKEAISLESAFAGVVKTTDGLVDSAGDLTAEGAAMKQEFRDLAKETPIAIEELMAIGELGGQLGIAKEDLIDFTETIAAMGVATNLTTEEAAVGFAQMANIMGTPSEEIENMGSAVVALGNNLATTERDVFNFATRIAGAGNIAGLTEAQVFGIAGAFSSVGIEAAAGGTAVQKVLLGINEAVLTGGAEMETFAAVAGISADEFGAAWEEDAGAVFTQFVEGLGAAGDDAVGILSDLGLEDQRLIKAFLSLSGAGDLLSDAIDLSTDAFRDNTALMAEAETRYATTESQIAIFKNTLRDVGFTIGGIVLPFFSQLIEAATNLVNIFLDRGFADFFTTFEDGSSAIGSFFEALGVGEETANAIGSTINTLVENLTDAKDSIVSFATPIVEWLGEKLPEAIAFIVENSEAFKGALIAIGAVLAGAGIISAIAGIVAALNPVTLVIMGIIAVAALLGAAWAANWGGIQEKTQAVIDFIQPLFEDAFKFISETVQTVLESMSGWWEENGETIIAVVLTLWEVLQSVFAAILTVLKPAWDTFVEGIKGGFSSMSPLVEAFQALWIALQPIIMALLAILGAAFLAFLSVVVGIFTGIAQAIEPFLVTVGMVVTNIVGIFTGLADFITGFVEFIIALFTKNSEDSAAAWEKMSDAVSSIVTNLVEGIVTLFVGLGITLFEFFEGLVTGIVDFFTNLYNELVGASIVVDLVNDILTLFLDMGTDLLETVTTFVTDIIAKFTEFGLEIIESVTTTITSMIAAFTDTNWVQLGVDIITGIKAGVVQAASILIDAVVAAAKAALDAVKEFLGVGSPSKLFAVEVGESIPEGTALGIIEKSHLVVDAIKDMVRDAFGAVEGIGGLGRKIGGFGGFFVGLQEKRVLDPLRKQLKAIDAQMAAVPPGLKSIVEEKRLRILQQIADEEAKIAEFRKQQEKFTFLQKQLDLVAFVKEMGLDASEIFKGITLGEDVDIGALMKIISSALNAAMGNLSGQLGSDSGSVDQPVPGIGLLSSQTNNSRELTINFEGNYASQPAVRDSNDLSLALGLAGVSA